MFYPTCKFYSCGRRSRRNGWCDGHSQQVRDGIEIRPLIAHLPQRGPCSVNGCTRDAKARGKCLQCYAREKRKIARGIHPPTTDTPMGETLTKVERQIADGTRCKCGLLADKDHPSCDLGPQWLANAVTNRKEVQFG